MQYRSRPGSSGLWRRDQVCQWRRDVDARGCGRIVRSGNVGASELNVSASGVAEGVVTLCLFPVTVAVVQQSVRKVGSCSLGVRARCCRVQWRRKRRRDRLKVGRRWC